MRPAQGTLRFIEYLDIAKCRYNRSRFIKKQDMDYYCKIIRQFLRTYKEYCLKNDLIDIDTLPLEDELRRFEAKVRQYTDTSN